MDNIIKKDFSHVDFQLSFNRQDSFPLDKSSIFYSYDDALNYAKNNPISYIGQPITVVIESEKKVYCYVIDFENKLTLVGSGNIVDIGLADEENDGLLSKEDFKKLKDLDENLSSKLGKEENAVSATKLQQPFTLSLSGDATGTIKIDGSENVTMEVEIEGSGGGGISGPITSDLVESMKNYEKSESYSPIEQTDSLNIAIGKIEAGYSEKLGINDNAVSASKFLKPIKLTLTGAATGETNFDGSKDISIAVDIDGNNHTHGSNNIITMDGYTRTELYSPISPKDNLNTAIGKLETKIVDFNENFIYRGTEEPEDKTVIWINPLEENYDYIPPGGNNLYDDISKQLSEFTEKINNMEYIITYKIDAGERTAEDIPEENNIKTFSNEEDEGLEGEYPDIDFDYRPQTNTDGYPDGKVKHICIARGNSRDYMGNLLAGEFYLDTKENQLYIGTGNKVLMVGQNSSSSGGGNLTGEYLQLTDSKGEVYTIRVNTNGKLEIYKASIDKQPLPNPNEPEAGGVFHENWDEYKSSDGTGICINQIYSGGPLNSGNTPVSHSFIELYNNSERDISLRGLSIQYAKFGKDWKVCPLDGILPGNTSYLIRCVQNTNPYKLACRVKIENFDIDWNQELSPTGMKVALVVGTEPLDTENPYRDPANGIDSIYRYIDMLGAGGVQSSQKIDYQEGYFARHCLDKNTAICRSFREGLKDHDNNLLDTIAIDYRYADIESYGPRCREDGPWDIYRDKIKLAENRPNMIFITFGKNQSSRIFTWQTKPTKEGYLKIRKKGEYDWITYESERRNISHHDTSAVTHKVQVNDLEEGIYEYKCGEEGMWSDESTFEVFSKYYGDFTSPETETSSYEDRVVKILHTSDQQGWDENEYYAWKNAHSFIYKNEKMNFINNKESPNYHWRFNTGDASQNGNRAYEWRYYYNFAKEDLCKTVEMLAIGNNDLIDKKKSEAYTYYSNYEDSPYPGCYEFFIGDIHFLSYNTWAGVDDDYVDLDGVSVGYTQRQIEWLKEKLRGPRKRWTIVITHVAPYTIVQQKQGQPYKEALEGNNGEYDPVDLVICGHNHAYSRSQPMLNDVIDKLNGVYHVMSQATGYKLSGKEKPNPEGEYWYGLMPDGSYAVGVPGNPSYIMWEITKDYIEFHSYMIQGIIQKDATTKEVTYGDPSTYKKVLIDTFKIYHRSVREQHYDEL